MAELQDFDLDPASPASASPASEPPAPKPPRRQQSIVPLMIGALAVAAVIVAVFWFLSRRVDTREPGPEATPAPSDATGAPAQPAPRNEADLPMAVEPLPRLAESDGFVRELLRRLSSHSLMPRWLAPPYLIERFVATVENIGTGTSPATHLGPLAPAGSYRAVRRDGTLEPDPANGLRHQALTQVFTAMDPDAAAATYRRLRPLFQEAYAELGYPDSDFDEALADAINTLLVTPVPESPAALEKMVTSYRYVDPDLEALPASQKAFLRMGPDNMRKIKIQLQAIADALDLNVR